MAVVFISPKQRQRVFFLGITVLFLLFLLAVSLGVFLAKPKEVLPTMVFNRPKVDINMGIFDSPQFKALQPFSEMQIQYAYTATTKEGQQKTGFITAVSVDAAQEILKSSGLTVNSMQETEIGRENPFVPYYQQVVLPTPKK
jgi:regulator of protease activity HflC (stomatin/prohibitin superfamily)